ncbi:MAG: T9SS type A sorting domain-containing protein [Bacteroidetes bacterium]|nr:T9SS type A sorting domain-containing protein [Bacteroidota bacterium]
MKKIYSLLLSGLLLFSALCFSFTAKAQVLYDNGPIFNSAGTGAGGANESVLYTGSFSMATIGFGHQQTTFNHVADDFVISDCAWRIDSIAFFAYQTGSTTTSTINGVYFRIWDNIPDAAGANVVYGDTVTNRLTRTGWSGVYRITETTTGASNRPIMRSVCSVNGLVLQGGTFWLDWSATGTLASGPWAVPRVPVMVAITGNGRQRTGTVWNNALDGGTNIPAQGFPFIIYGTALNATADAGLGGAYCDTGLITLGGSPAGTGMGTLAFSWSPANGLSDSAIANPVASPSTTTAYVLTVSDTMGCVVRDTVEVIVNNTQTATLTEVACGSYTSPAGNIYTTSGIYTDTLATAAGCDSLITINLTVNQIATLTLNITECGTTYNSPAGNVYTTSGTYIDTVSSASGCDSIITITLSFQLPTASTIAPVVCNSYTSPGGQVLTASGMYMDTIPNAAGCDSVITINLTVNSATTSSITVNTCGVYTAPSGATYSETGIYTDTIANTSGCDSIITINLSTVVFNLGTIIGSNGYEITSLDSLPGTTWQWLYCDNNFLPAPGGNMQTFYNSYVTGNFAVQVTNGNCVDTSACVYVIAWGIEEFLRGQAIQLYPNPNNGFFMLDLLSPAQDIRLTISDITGRAIWTNTVSNAQFVPVNFEGPAGMYIIRIETETYSAVKNWMKSE